MTSATPTVLNKLDPKEKLKKMMYDNMQLKVADMMKKQEEEKKKNMDYQNQLKL